MHLKLSVLSEKLAVSRLDSSTPIPSWGMQGTIYSITKTTDEISIVCETQYVPAGIKNERGWRAFKVEGTLDFSLVGIMGNLSGILATAEISVFVISTFDTDYVLIKEENLEKAKELFQQAGHTVQ